MAEKQDETEKPMERPKGITRRELLKGVAAGAGIAAVGAAAGVFAGREIEKEARMREEAERIITVDQRFFERMRKLEKEIRELHNSSNALVRHYERRDLALDVFDAKLKVKYSDKLKTPEGLNWGLGDDELFFAQSRFKTVDGAEVKQAELVLPNRYSEVDFETILKDVQDGLWNIEGFQPYSSAAEKYSDSYGSITAFIPSEKLPNDHFLFVFSHRRDTGEWVQQIATAFQVVADGQKFIFLNFESYNPSRVPPQLALPEPRFDKIAIFTTDINGQPLEKRVSEQPHWAAIY